MWKAYRPKVFKHEVWIIVGWSLRCANLGMISMMSIIKIKNNFKTPKESSVVAHQGREGLYIIAPSNLLNNKKHEPNNSLEWGSESQTMHWQLPFNAYSKLNALGGNGWSVISTCETNFSPSSFPLFLLFLLFIASLLPCFTCHSFLIPFSFLSFFFAE